MIETSAPIGVQPAQYNELMRLNAIHESFDRAIYLVEEQLGETRSGRLVIGELANLKEGMPQEVLNELIGSIRFIEGLPDNIGGFNRGMLVQGMVSEQIDRTPRGPASPAAPTCAGVNMMATYWWGRRIWIDECRTQQLIKILELGGNITFAISVLFPQFLLILGTVLKLSAQAIKVVDDLGGNKGVFLSETWTGHGWIWHQ